MKKYLKILIAPLCILALIILTGLMWKLFNFPSQKELIPIIKNYFDTYGIWLVLIAAIVESGFVLGIYAPGGLVIFLGVIFSIGDPLRAIFVVATVILGFIIGFTVDFFLGRYGWYKFLIHFGLEKALLKVKERVEKYNISTAWLGYHHPDVGSLIATTYGILQYSYKKFLLITLPAVIAWSALWGFIAYIFGDKVLTMMGYKMLFIILGVWIVVRIVEVRMKERRIKI